MTFAPHGSWKSPITSAAIAAGAVRLHDVALDGDATYWLESRPTEGGRYVVVHRSPEGATTDVTPPPLSARTRVHEYGGGSFTVADATLYFTNDADQRLYRRDQDGALTPLTPEGNLRYADFRLDNIRSRLIGVREDHTAGPETHGPLNAIVAVPTDGASVGDGGAILVGGNDFYSNPRLSPDGRRLAWLTWHHPNMPWDGTELWVAEVLAGGALAGARLVAGGPEHSIFQPEWSSDGVLHFVSDRSGWWNLYRLERDGAVPLAPMEAEFGQPQWVFGQSTYGFASADQIVGAYTRQGRWQLALVDVPGRRLHTVDTPFTEIGAVRVGRGSVTILAGSPTMATAVVRHDLRTGRYEILRRSTSLEIDPGYLSLPRSLEFPTTDGTTAHGHFYPPRNADFTAPAGEQPPLVVIGHGGPTGAASTTLSLPIQYWTSRGFAVLDVDYRGSTGYGRAYRERLNERWGVVDVDDCVQGARHLAAEGLVDGQRLAIRGWSASGYTALAALTFRDVFKAGASHFGISDLEALARDTHKFESRYLDRLIGPYPARRDRYLARSPIHHVDRLACPLILFQGLEDRVVPPDQAQKMYDAVRAKGLPVALVMFEGEQHGFRRAENIRRALDGELYFLSRVFGFEPAEPLDPVPIANG